MSSKMRTLPSKQKRGRMPSLATLDLVNDNKLGRLQEAILAAKKWSRLKRENRNSHVSMVLIASGVPGDLNKTGYGVGKTHIARCIQWSEHLVSGGEPHSPCGIFVAADDLVQYPQEVIEKITSRDAEGSRPHVLVIDDVGAEKQIDYIGKDEQQGERQARYFNVINSCYDPDGISGVSVVITGNLTIAQLRVVIGGRAFSRLLEMVPTGMFVDLTGIEDWRKKSGGR